MFLKTAWFKALAIVKLAQADECNQHLRSKSGFKFISRQLITQRLFPHGV